MKLRQASLAVLSPKTPVIFPGAPFAVGALLFLLALLFALRTPENRGVTAASAVEAG